MLRPYNVDRSPRPRVAHEGAALMLGNTNGQIVTRRATNVVRIVGALQHVDERTHRRSAFTRNAAFSTSVTCDSPPPGPPVPCRTTDVRSLSAHSCDSSANDRCRYSPS